MYGLVVAAVCAVLAAILTATLRVTQAHLQSDDVRSYLGATWAGIAVVWKTPLLRSVGSWRPGRSEAAPLTVALTAALQIDGRAVELVAVLGAFSLGAVAAAVVTGRWAPSRNRRRIVVTGLAVSGPSKRTCAAAS